MEVNLIMDNDSGYSSYHQESNFDSSLDGCSVHAKSPPKRNFCINEDTLLEKPAANNQGSLFPKSDSFDSVINSSQPSVKSVFSGFEDSDVSWSDSSFVIPVAKSLIFNRNDLPDDDPINTTNDSPNETLNCSRDSILSFSESSFMSAASLDSSRSNRKHVLSNITNTYQSASRAAFLDDDKENVDPSATPKKRYENRISPNASPDLFSEDEATSRRAQTPAKKRKRDTFCAKDVKLLRRAQKSLGGVCPPPGLTVVQMTVAEMLSKIEQNRGLFWGVSEGGARGRSLLIGDDPEVVYKKWPDVLEERFHGIHFNRNKISEDFEHLCGKYAERYVGAETQSSCRVFEGNLPSPLKRKALKPRWAVKSPGKRLSHLARRRITFSSSNLQAASSSCILGARARQIVVDVKKPGQPNKRKSPRKTPSKSPFKPKKSPSSSAKKKLGMRFRKVSGEAADSAGPGPSAESYKRALFQSPLKNVAGPSGHTSERKSTKRALFSSPTKNSPSKSPLHDRKRKRTDHDEANLSKFPRSMSMESSSRPTLSLMNRTLSESHVRNELSEVQKKKLQWAVYEALRLQNITPTHPQFKVFASVLARVTRKFLPNLKVEGRTTEKMFRIARHHSYSVVKGRSVDEIVNEYLKNRARMQKPQGYVAIEDGANKENVADEKIEKSTIIQSIEKRREQAGATTRFLGESRIDRIKKVISFEDSK